MTSHDDIEIGEIVTVVGGEFDGLSGTLDNVWMNDGIQTFTVVFDDEEFAYATAIRRFK